MDHSSEVGHHYDSISGYMYWYNAIKKFGKVEPNFHRLMKAPPEWKKRHKGHSTSNYLNDLVLEMMQLPFNPTVLDAGCGFGGTLFWFCTKITGDFHGISLSEYQIRRANTLAEDFGISDRCTFKLQSYDEPLDREYDGVLTIESLIHSEDLSGSIRNLSDHIKPGGRLVIVEEMLTSESQNLNEKHIAQVKSSWKVKDLPTISHYTNALHRANLNIIYQNDLTALTPILNKTMLQALQFSFRLLKLIPSNTIRQILTFHESQLLLLDLYQKEKLAYFMIAAEKS